MFKKGALVKRSDGMTGTVMRKYTKVYTDHNDDLANAAGFDSCTVGTAVEILWYDGTKRSYKYGYCSRNFKVLA